MKFFIAVLILSAICLSGCKEGSSSSGIGGAYERYTYEDGADNGTGGGDTSAQPEPATIALFGSGLLGLAGYALAKMRRKK